MVRAAKRVYFGFSNSGKRHVLVDTKIWGPLQQCGSATRLAGNKRFPRFNLALGLKQEAERTLSLREALCASRFMHRFGATPEASVLAPWGRRVIKVGLFG
jgi:hypothetical protein